MNIIKKLLKKCRGNEEIDIKEVENLLKNSNAILVDVRSNQEYKEYHLEGAICIPNYEIKQKAKELLKDKEQVIILYCSVGARSKKIMNELRKMGYKNLYHLKNGLEGI